MTAALYAPDRIGTWHMVAATNEFKPEVRGKCGHDFEPARPPVEKRPHPDKYCCGCLGVEEREARKEVKT
jgi:hypothetical protein